MILDASAVMAVILNEAGADKVRPHFGSAAMSVINYSEAITAAQGKGVAGNDAIRFLQNFGLVIIEMTEQQARNAALLWPVTKAASLSLGDRVCLALALELDDEILTSDRAWITVPHGAKVTLIR